MSDQSIPNEPNGGREPTEEEIRAALEEEMRRVHVGDVVLQAVVTLVQLAGRRLGTAPGTEAERDLGQARVAIDSVSALLPSVEQVAPGQAAAVRDALAQLQLAFVQAGGQVAPGEQASGDERPPEHGGEPEQGQGPSGPDPGPGGTGGPGQGGSRIWVPPGVR